MAKSNSTSVISNDLINNVVITVSDAKGLCSLLAGYTMEMGGQDPDIASAISVLHTQLVKAQKLVDQLTVPSKNS